MANMSSTNTRYLHPLSVVFELAKMIRNNIIPTIIAVIGFGNAGWIGVYVCGTILSIGLLIVFLRYFTFRYEILEDHLILHQGLLDRLNRNIPYEKIENVDLTQNIFHRWLKVAEVRIETASGTETEATMRVISLVDVDRIKQAIAQFNSQTRAIANEIRQVDPTEQDEQPTTSNPRQHVLLELPARLLCWAGFLSNRGEVIAGLLLGTFWQWKTQSWKLDRFQGGSKSGTRDSIREATRGIVADGNYLKGIYTYILEHYGMAGWCGLLLLSLLLVLVLLRTFSAIWYIVKFYGYRLERIEDVLHVRCGLFTQVSAAIPTGRIQLISVQRTWWQRRFGLSSIRIETAGGNENESDDAKSIGRKWFVPIIEHRDVPQFLRSIDSRINLEESSIPWQGLSPDAAKRMLRPTVGVAILLALIGLYLQPLWGWSVGVAMLLVAWPWVLKKSKSRRFCRTNWGIIYRSGTWKQKCSMSFFDKIHSARVSQNPFDRRWKMASLSIDTAASGPADHTIDVEYLDAHQAERELEQIKSCIYSHQTAEYQVA